jgi:Thiol-activated cytolysin
MVPSLRTCVRSGVLSVFIMAVSACGRSEFSPLTAAATDPPPARGGPNLFNQIVSGFGGWDGALSDTTAAPPVALPQSVLTAANGDNWICSNTQQDEKRNLDQLLAPGNAAGVLWPGALIQGASLTGGEPAEIPLPRSPISISIDLAVDSASRTIDDPTSASVQVAVAELQREADARLGPIDVVPARIDFEQTEAFSTNQFILAFGASAQASTPLKVLGIPVPGSASLGVSDSLGVEVSFQVHTIAVKLMQPMYAISFADEDKTTPGEYLASSVTDSDVAGVAARGMLGGSNLPTYVKSVTYGRMVVFTLRNTSFATVGDMEGAVQASLNLFKLGIGGSGGNKLSVKDSLLLQNSDLQVVAFGGSQDSALAAIRTGDLGKFFTSVPATQAVPLGYRINYLKNGQVALLGFGTNYTESSCTPSGTKFRYWHIKLDSLTSNGGCDSTDYVRRSYVIVPDLNIPTGVLYPLLDVESGPMADTVVNRDIVLQLPDSAVYGSRSGITLESWFFPGTSTTTCGGSSSLYLCQSEKDIGSSAQFAVNPYVFSQILTLPGADDACTVTFTYEIDLEPALDRQGARRVGG